MLTTLLLFASPSLAAPPDSLPPLEQARRYRRNGAWQLGLGTLAVAGGFGLLTIGRPSNQISTETDVVREVRDISGVLLLIGGVTSAVVGVNSFERARQAKASAQVGIAPLLVPQGGGLTVVGRF